MKTINELRSQINFPVREINYMVKYFFQKNIDYDVFLKTKGYNLQRSFVWNTQQKRELIWSILINRNIPRMAIINTINDEFLIIDGKQRLNAIYEFINNKFTLIIDRVKYYFADLPPEYQRAINSFNLSFYEHLESFDNSLTDDQKITWFTLINFSGTLQDLKHMKKLTIKQND